METKLVHFFHPLALLSSLAVRKNRQNCCTFVTGCLQKVLDEYKLTLNEGV